MKKLTLGQKRKLTLELICIASAIFGIVIFILNALKLVPEGSLAIQFLIAYGFIIGPVFVILGIATFFETRKIRVRRFTKKAR